MINFKKLLAGTLSAAMVLGTMAMPVFADETEQKVSLTGGDFIEKRNSVSEYTNSTFTYEINGKVEIGNSEEWTNVLKTDAIGVKDVKTVKFVGTTEDAEINIKTGPTILAWQGHALNVEFENLKLSNSDPKWKDDIGHASNFFTTFLRCGDAANCSVSYKNCTFANGSCNNQYGKTVYTDCTFNSTNNYCLWLYGGDTTVNGNQNTFSGVKGVKLYSEDATKAVNATIENAKFNITGKPAVVSSTWGDIKLNNVDTTECELGVLESEPNNHTKDGALINNTLADIKIDDKKPTFVAKVGNVIFTDMKAALNEANNDETKIETPVAQINDTNYFSLAEAFTAAQEGDTIKLLDDISLDSSIVIENKKGITFDGNNKKITCNVETTALNLKYFKDFTIKDLTLEGKARYGILLNGGTNKTLENVTISGDYLFSFMALNTGGATFKNCNLSNVNTGKVKSDTVSEYIAGSVWTNVDTANGTEMLSLISSKIDGITVNGYREGVNPIIPKIVVDENSETKIYTIENEYQNEDTPKSKLFCLSPDSKGKVTVQEILYDGNNVKSVSETIVPVAVVDGKYYDNMDEAKKAAGESGTVTPYPANKVKISFEPANSTEDNSAVYDLYVETDDSVINRLTSAHLTFALKTTSGAIEYEVKGADNVSVTGDVNNANRYLFNFDGTNAADASGKKIKIGQIVFNGVGTFEFAVTGNDNIVNATQLVDNIVKSYEANQENGTLDLGEGIPETELKPETADLIVNVSFPNAIKDNAVAYQNMKVTVSGNGVNKEFKLGTGNDGVALNNGEYKVELTGTLVKNNTYTVTVSGAGYRTARYTVSMTGNKELNFWNNVKTAPVFVEEGVGTGSRTNFLAGDIVKDGQINIYDLSAVVSYFGQAGIDTSKVSQYAKYDLNRDGVIDSMDVAYVLVSWGK